MTKHRPLRKKTDIKHKADSDASRNAGAVTLLNSGLTGFLALYAASNSGLTALIGFGLAVCLAAFYLWSS
jgi:hypothetical protein